MKDFCANKFMLEDWNLRDYILTLTHRWHLVARAFLVGALLGWGASKLLPPTYRANLDLYVGIDAYRGPRDRYIVGVAQDEFRNLDDYKNWNMEQLNELARGDDYLIAALAALQVEDPYWHDIAPADLHPMLRGSWRNAGRWHLAAEAENPEHAAQLVCAWAVVVNERVNTAIGHARQVVALDTRMVALADELAEMEQRQRLLTQIDLNLADFYEDVETSQVVDIYTRDRMLAQAARAADWGAGWSLILEAIPAPQADDAAYLAWLSEVRALLQADLYDLPARINDLQVQYDRLAEDYAREAELSWALSANLSLGLPEEIAPAVEDIRPAGRLMLVGGFVAVLAWLLVELARSTPRGKI